MNPPYPLEITAFESPSPSEFPMIFRGGGGGMDIFWKHTLSLILIWVNPIRKGIVLLTNMVTLSYGDKPRMAVARNTIGML